MEPTPQQLTEQKNRQSQYFQTQQWEDQDATLQQFKSGEISYNEEFITSQIKSQQDFYGDYERKWNHQPEGFLVTPPEQFDAPEIELQNTKLGYRERKERKQTVENNYDLWRGKMAGYVKERDAIEPDYGLRLRGIYGLKLQEKRVKHNVNRHVERTVPINHGAYALDIMKSTMRMGETEKFQIQAVNEMMQEKKPHPLFMKYFRQIIAMAPKLETTEGQAFGDISITQGSMETYKTYIAKAMDNPIEVMKGAACDALFSLNQISEKLLDKKNIPQKFDEVKALRDRLKAVSDLFDPDESDEMTEAFRQLADNKEIALSDNVTIAKALYQRIDMDMRYVLEKENIQFEDTGQLVDRQDVRNAHIKKDGNQAVALLRAAKNKLAGQFGRDNERYWDRQCKDLLQEDKKQEDEKESKKSKKDRSETSDDSFEDTYNLAGALEAVKAGKRGIVKGKENKALFDDLVDNGNQIALAVSRIDKELAQSETVFERRAEEFRSRPEAKIRLEKYIAKIKKQQVILLDRAAGIMNALNYLAGAGELNANGNNVLEETKFIKNKAVEVVHDKDGQVLSVNEFDKIEYIRGEMFGSRQDVKELSGAPLTFKNAKNKLLDKFKDKADNRLRGLLERGSAELRYNFLVMQQENLFNMNYEMLCDKLDEATTIERYTEKLRSTIVSNNKKADKLYSILSSQELAPMDQAERAKLIEDYKDLQKTIYAANKLKKMKPGTSNMTLDVLLKNNKTVAEVQTFKNNELITSMKFKMVGDMLEVFRCKTIVKEIENGGNISEICSEAEKSMILKVDDVKELKQYFSNKAEAADFLHGKHLVEYVETAQKNQEIDNLIDQRFNELGDQEQEQQRDIILNDQYNLNELDLEDEELNYDNVIHENEEYTEQERKGRRKKKTEVVVSTQEKEGFKERDFVARNNYIKTYGLKEITELEKTVRYIKDYSGADNCLGKGLFEFSKFMLGGNLAGFKQQVHDLDATFVDIEKKEGDEQLIADLQQAFKTLAEGGYEENIIKKIIPGKTLEGSNIDAIDMSIQANDKDYKWFMSLLGGISSLKDVAVVREHWQLRDRYLRTVYGKGCNAVVYHKGNAILSAIADIYEKREKAEKVKKNVDGISGYQSSVKDKEKVFSLKDDDKDSVYKFDQHQQGNYGCWAASHTYVMNAYMKVHKIEGEKFTQAKFKNGDLFVPHETALKYMEDQSDQNPESMSFNQEASNIQNFLQRDKTGNPYVTADTVINALPKTAEHHLVFTNFYLNVMDEKKDEVKTKLTDYVMDKVEGELNRTKVPISLLRNGHYLSIVGVDRKNQQLITMDSLKKGTKIEEPTLVKVSDLIEMDKFELVYPENLEAENLKYLSGKFGLKDDLYDQEGKMQMTDEIKKIEKEGQEKPQNMLHVNGVEFERKTRDFDFEENFVAEQIYMPKDLKIGGEKK